MKFAKRIQEDYLKKSRLPEYRTILQTAKTHGYKMVGIRDLYYLVQNGEIENTKVLINRHDIDTSPKVARKMFEIECDVFGHQGSATYYFRDCTIDKELISDIEKYGYETGYHYEEIATYEKKYKMKNLNALQEHILEIGEIFLEDLMSFRANTASKSNTVASHGDFINSKYKFQNYEILKNKKVRELSGILVEAYDEIVTDCVLERYADQVLLERFAECVLDSIERQCSCIMLLTHPRNWEVDLIDTTRENIVRLKQGIEYRR